MNRTKNYFDDNIIRKCNIESYNQTSLRICEESIFVFMTNKSINRTVTYIIMLLQSQQLNLTTKCESEYVGLNGII